MLQCPNMWHIVSAQFILAAITVAIIIIVIERDYCDFTLEKPNKVRRVIDLRLIDKRSYSCR